MSKKSICSQSRKIALLHASIVVPHCIKAFRKGPWGVGDKHKGILMSLLFLAEETKTKIEFRRPEIQKIPFTFTKHATIGFEKLANLCKCTEEMKTTFKPGRLSQKFHFK